MTNTTIRWGNGYDDARESKKRLNLLKKDIASDTRAIENPTALDLGANIGFFSHGLADMGLRVTAVEPPSDKDLSHPGVVEYRHWVQSSDDLPEGPFHYAIVLSVLHHIPQWRDVLEGVFDRTQRRVYVEVPHTAEHHEKWHGSRKQYEYLKNMENSRVIGEHYEVSKRYKRPLFRVDL